MSVGLLVTARLTPSPFCSCPGVLCLRRVSKPVCIRRPSCGFVHFLPVLCSYTFLYIHSILHKGEATIQCSNMYNKSVAAAWSKWSRSHTSTSGKHSACRECRLQKPKWKRNFANRKDDEWRPTGTDESVLSNFIECIAGVRKAFPKLSNVVVVVY